MSRGPIRLAVAARRRCASGTAARTESKGGHGVRRPARGECRRDYMARLESRPRGSSERGRDSSLATLVTSVLDDGRNYICPGFESRRLQQRYGAVAQQVGQCFRRRLSQRGYERTREIMSAERTY